MTLLRSKQQLAFVAIDPLMAQISQTAAWSRCHEVHALLVRWLLMSAHRLSSREFRPSRELLARRMCRPLALAATTPREEMR